MAEDHHLDSQAMAVLDALGEGITIHDAEGEMIAANRAAREILRLEESELLSRAYDDPAWEITTLDGRPLAPDELPAARAIEDGRPVRNAEIVVERPDAPPVILSVNAVPIFDDDRVEMAIISFRDVTEQRRAERRFQRLFRDSPVGIALVAPDGRPLEMNRALAEMLGREPSELAETPFPEFTHPDDVQKDVELFEQLVGGEIGDYQIRKRFLTPDGEVVWADLRVSSLRSPGDDPPLVVAFARDITEQQQLESELREREQEYETLLTEISDVVTVLDQDGTIRYESPSIGRVFGYEPNELVGRSAFEMVHPDDVDEVSDQFLRAVSAGETTTVQYRFRHADGSWRLVESTGVVPEIEGLEAVTVTRDITDRAEAQQKYRAIFDTVPSAVAVATVDDHEYVEVNRAFEDLLGRSREEVVGATAEELGMWARPAERERVVRRIRESGTVQNLEVQIRNAEGEHVDVLFSGSALEIAGRRYFLGVAQDITERKQFEEALERQALHDQLTGLPNRTLFRDRLQHALERADRSGDRVAVLFLDLDRFKTVNDSLGHPAGDRVLRTVAGRLTQSLREEDTVARVGGDEFAVLLEDLDAPSDIEGAVTRIQRVFETPLEVDGTAFELTASIGVAHSGLGFSVPDELVRLADAAMYRVKQPGSTDFHVFDPETDQEVTERLQREAALKAAVREDQFVVHYQPIYRLETREIVGAEALVRWRHPELGLVHPGDFIPLAEETGLIVPMGRRVLEQALRQYARWRDRSVLPTDDFRVSVNLSARQHEEADLVDAIARAAEDAGAPLSGLVLEITETVAMTGPDTFQPLRRDGLGIAIDDFGTGYSSLEYLRHFAADLLKLDRSFVAHLERRDQTTPLVRGILDVAERMEMDVVAEGIETEEQLALLEDFGCAYGQGFLFARPMPADDFTSLLEDQGE